VTVTVVEVATIVGCLALVMAFVLGLFVGARLARPSFGRAGDRHPARAEAAALALQLLREALTVVRDLRGHADMREQTALPLTPKKSHRKHSSTATKRKKD
jgi:hypothetical protein